MRREATGRRGAQRWSAWMSGAGRGRRETSVSVDWVKVHESKGGTESSVHRPMSSCTPGLSSPPPFAARPHATNPRSPIAPATYPHPCSGREFLVPARGRCWLSRKTPNAAALGGKPGVRRQPVMQCPTHGARRGRELDDDVIGGCTPTMLAEFLRQKPIDESLR